MKRYVLFVAAAYYPNGGWRDFWDSYDSLEGAIVEADKRSGAFQDSHVVDLTTGEIVYEK